MSMMVVMAVMVAVLHCFDHKARVLLMSNGLIAVYRLSG
jgi:hypothetical protein